MLQLESWEKALISPKYQEVVISVVLGVGLQQTPLSGETGTVFGNPCWSQQQPLSSKLLSLGLEFSAIKSLKRF